MLRMNMGRTEQAIEWFVIACEERTPQMAFFQFVNERKFFEPVRRHHRYDEIVRCLADH